MASVISSCQAVVTNASRARGRGPRIAESLRGAPLINLLDYSASLTSSFK